MTESKLILLLKGLTSEEILKFSRFIDSPYYSKSKALIRLFIYLRKLHPLFEKAKLEKKRVFKKVFPEAKYSDIKLRNLMSKLTKVVEDFLLHLELKQDEYKRKKALVQVYNRRNIYDLFEKETLKTIDYLEALSKKDSNFFKEKYHLLFHLYFHPMTTKQGKKGNLVEEAYRNLIYYSELERLYLLSELKNRASIFKENRSIDFESNLSYELEENPMYISLLKLVELIQNQDQEIYISLKHFFIENLATLSTRDKRFLFYHLLNFVVKHIPIDDQHWLKEAFQWYRIGIDHSILIYNNRITDITFINITVTGSKIKEFEWVRRFILDNEIYLDERTKGEVKILSLAFLHFNMGEYNITIDLLITKRFREILPQLNAKTLLIRSYYELFYSNPSYFDVLIDACTAFEMFVRRNSKMSKEKEKVYLNFSQFIKKLARAKNKPNKKRNTIHLSQQLKETKLIIVRSWLKEKIALLEN